MTVSEVRELVRAGGLLPPGRTLVAMLSGGRDSVCLLDVAVALTGAEYVRAIHVNYGLRSESDGDEAHCRELCRVLGVEIEVVRSAREPHASGNLHAWARDVRYRSARELAERMDIASGTVDSVEEDPHARAPVGTRVATGHTATDQVETILYRLAASPGRRALLGMPSEEGRLVRPLLTLTREETAAYCVERNLAWREDTSNDSLDYARARVRHGVVQALDAVHPASQRNVLRTAALLREETHVLNELVDSELKNGSTISIKRLSELPAALARLVVIRLAEDTAGTFVPQAGDRVAEILTLGQRGGRAELHIGGLVGAVVCDGELSVVVIHRRDQTISP